MNNNKILAIIPARGGSKGLPGKNIRPMLGKPLIIHAIDAIRGSKYPIDIVISTDSKDIANVGKSVGVETIFRPDELAKDNSLVKDAIQYTIQELKNKGREYDTLLLIEATSPLRQSTDIDNCLKEWQKETNVDCLATFSLLDPPVTRIWKIQENTPTPFIEGANPFKPRQEQTYGYFINGLVYIFNIQSLMSNHTDTLFVGKQIAVITEKPVIDIDTEFDFIMAETALKYFYNHETIK